MSFGYHAFAVNEADELHISDFVAGLTELKDVYPRIINGADIPVSKLGVLAQTTVDTLATPHSHSATSTAAPLPTPHHLTLSTFRQVMLNQPWFLDLLSLMQEQFQRKTRSTREWNSHLLLLRSKERAVLTSLDDVVKRRVPGSKKEKKTARGSESGGGKHMRRQSTMHARAMERIGRRQSSVLPEVGLQELTKEMAQLAEEERSDDMSGGEHHHTSGDESSRSARGSTDGSTHRKSALRRPSRHHQLATRRKSSISKEHLQEPESPFPEGSPSLSSRKHGHRRNHTMAVDTPPSRARGVSAADGSEDGAGAGAVKGLRQASQSHSHRPQRMRNGRSSVDVGAMDRVQQQRMQHVLRRNSTGSSEEGHDAEGKKSSRGAEEIKEEEQVHAPQTEVLQPALQPRSSRSQLGGERVSVNSAESGVFRSRTNSGLTRVNERVSREDDTAAASDDTISPSIKSSPSSPPSHTRPALTAAVGTSPSLAHKSASTSHSRSHTSGDHVSAASTGMSPPVVSQRLHASSDEQDDQLTRLQAITAQKKLSVSTAHRKSSVARASVDDPTLSDSDGNEQQPPMPRRGSVLRENASVRTSPHGAEQRVIGEVGSSNSASPNSVKREVVRRRNDSVSREEERESHAQHVRGSVSREHHSPVHSESYRNELLQENHSRYGSSPNLRPDRTSTSTSYSHHQQQATLQHTRSVPMSSHHTASPLNAGSLRPSLSTGLAGSPYPHSRQASVSMAAIQPMGAWDGSGGSVGEMGGGGLYRSSFSGMQAGVVGGAAAAASMHGFAPAKHMSLSLSPQPMARQLPY